MDATALFKSGKLIEAIDSQVAAVKAAPTDQGRRLFLFELLCFAAEWDRAQRQIDAMSPDQPEVAAAILDYRKMLESERKRRLVFAEKAQPGFLTTPPEHVRLRLLGLSKIVDGAAKDAGELFELANGQAPPVAGKLNEQAFTALRDGDDCLGTVLEVFARGEYFWVPLEQIEALTMNAPRFPRDLLWIPAHLETHSGEAGSVFLPAIYPGTEKESDVQLKLGRLTDWRGEAPIRGVGVKTFFVGAEESSILDWRKLEVTPTEPAPTGA